MSDEQKQPVFLSPDEILAAVRQMNEEWVRFQMHAEIASEAMDKAFADIRANLNSILDRNALRVELNARAAAELTGDGSALRVLCIGDAR